MAAEKEASKKHPVTPGGPAHPDARRVTVMGLGNILLSDEGVGVRAVSALRSKYTFYPPVEIVDGGTMGLDLLPYFQDGDRMLILDAVDFRKSHGYIDLVEGDSIRSVLNTKLTVHHIGLSDLLYAAKLTRENPLEVCLIGIQPKSLNIGLEMTDEISNKLDTIVLLAVNKLQQWDIRCQSVQ